MKKSKAYKAIRTVLVILFCLVILSISVSSSTFLDSVFNFFGIEKTYGTIEETKKTKEISLTDKRYIPGYCIFTPKPICGDGICDCKEIFLYKKSKTEKNFKNACYQDCSIGSITKREFPLIPNATKEKNIVITKSGKKTETIFASFANFSSNGSYVSYDGSRDYLFNDTFVKITDHIGNCNIYYPKLNSITGQPIGAKGTKASTTIKCQTGITTSFNYNISLLIAYFLREGFHFVSDKKLAKGNDVINITNSTLIYKLKHGNEKELITIYQDGSQKKEIYVNGSKIMVSLSGNGAYSEKIDYIGPTRVVSSSLAKSRAVNSVVWEHGWDETVTTEEYERGERKDAIDTLVSFFRSNDYTKEQAEKQMKSQGLDESFINSIIGELSKEPEKNLRQEPHSETIEDIYQQINGFISQRYNNQITSAIADKFMQLFKSLTGLDWEKEVSSFIDDNLPFLNGISYLQDNICGNIRKTSTTSFTAHARNNENSSSALYIIISSKRKSNIYTITWEIKNNLKQELKYEIILGNDIVFNASLQQDTKIEKEINIASKKNYSLVSISLKNYILSNGENIISNVIE